MGDELMSRTKRSPSPKTVALYALAGIVGLVAVTVIGFNAYIKIAYSNFYKETRAEFATPEIASGFVPQDLDLLEDGTWLFSGYMDDGSPSPIVRKSVEGAVSQVYVQEPTGTVYAGHGGGITDSGDFVYLTCGNGFLVIKSADVMGAPDGGTVEAVAFIDVGFEPAFINTQDGIMFTGVFYKADTQYGDTPSVMHIEAADGTLNHAIMYAYRLDNTKIYGFKEVPEAVYSIPDEVQGICLDRNANFVFSTSYGFAPSYLTTYNSLLAASGVYGVPGEFGADEGVEWVPLFKFGKSDIISRFECPPMGEGIIYHDGRVYIANESACNKYVFGKLYGGSTIYSVAM